MIEKLTKRTYPCQLIINRKKITSLEISTHYEKHEDINDELIRKLIQELNNGIFVPDGEKDGWEYFRTEPLLDKEKSYKLVWCWLKEGSFIRIRTCHRTKKKYF